MPTQDDALDPTEQAMLTLAAEAFLLDLSARQLMEFRAGARAYQTIDRLTPAVQLTARQQAARSVRDSIRARIADRAVEVEVDQGLTRMPLMRIFDDEVMDRFRASVIRGDPAQTFRNAFAAMIGPRAAELSEHRLAAEAFRILVDQELQGTGHSSGYDQL